MPYGSKLYIPPTNYYQKRLTLNQKRFKMFCRRKKRGWGERHDKKSLRTRQKSERGDRKERSNDSPETPDSENEV